METSFLEKLLLFYEEAPNDPFNLYALALEYQKTDAEKASNHFRDLLKKHPDYLPTYYQAAQFFGESGDVDFVESIFEKGVRLAVNQKNVKAEQELERAWRAYKDEQLDW